ncbi:MAG: universal stress protein, partial [Alphaproteobacteria bacterium]|nr:universal stress protein [Alphaproteobacteria bacterium]
MPGDQGKVSRYRILVCLDGSDEGYRGLRYAAKLSGGVEAYVTVLHLRSPDSTLPEGLEDLSPEADMFQWGRKAPGVIYLDNARKLLEELGVMRADWHVRFGHEARDDDPLGNNKAVYEQDGVPRVTFRNDVAA